jgi:homoserine dehydrogenase
VVSALHGETDDLLAQAARVGGEPADSFVARLVRIGELRSAALLGLALERMGVRTATLDLMKWGLRAEGAALDSDLIG